MKNLTLTEAINLAYKILNSEYCYIAVSIKKSKLTGIEKPVWSIYDSRLGFSSECSTFEEAIEELRIISNTADRTKDVII